MKKILSLGLAFLLWAALPCRAAAEGEALPEPSPSVSPAVSSPSPEAPGGGTTAADTLPELPLPDFSPSPEPSPPPSEAALSQGPDAPASDSSSIFDFLEGSNATMEVDMIAYYLGEMTAAATKGDTKAGLEAEKNRNALIDMKGSGEEKISFDDLYLLSKLIYAEAGSDWLGSGAEPGGIPGIPRHALRCDIPEEPVRQRQQPGLCHPGPQPGLRGCGPAAFAGGEADGAQRGLPVQLCPGGDFFHP